MDLTIDMTASALVEYIVSIHPEIASVSLEQYSPRPNFGSVEHKLSSIEKLRRRLSQATGRHCTVLRDEIFRGGIRGRIAELRDGEAISIVSPVVLSTGNRADIPLMDFDPSVGGEKLGTLLERIREVDPGGGAIVYSGGGYHYYGRRLLYGEEWRQFVGKCLLLHDLVDVRYVGHCLIANETSLRISPRTTSDAYPKVIQLT